MGWLVELRTNPRLWDQMWIGGMWASLGQQGLIDAHVYLRSDPDGPGLSVYTNATRYALQRVLLKLGRKRFGPYPPEVEDAVENLGDDERLCDMVERVVDATSWDDLLATPARGWTWETGSTPATPDPAL
jgi:hypothetical protein